MHFRVFQIGFNQKALINYLYIAQTQPTELRLVLVDVTTRPFYQTVSTFLTAKHENMENNYIQRCLCSSKVLRLSFFSLCLSHTFCEK